MRIFYIFGKKRYETICLAIRLERWAKINETGNLESLRDEKRPGRTSRLSVEQQEELKLVLQKHSEESGMDYNIGDGKSLSAYIDK